MVDEYGTFGGIELTRGIEELGENLHQYHIVYHESQMTFGRTRAAAVGSRRLTAWAMARPSLLANLTGREVWLRSNVQ
jgi:hypothetical protein